MSGTTTCARCARQVPRRGVVWPEGFVCNRCYQQATFVAWAVRNRHLPDVEIPRRQARSTPVTAEEDRLTALRKALHDSRCASTRTRLAAVLVLLFAQPVTRICRLRLDDITDDGHGVAVALGSTPAQLPEVVLPLLQAHLADRGNTHTAANTDSPWLFPGSRPGQPITANAMMIELREAGIDLRGARNAALRALTLDMPPAIAADVLGYSATVTEAHARNAATRWNTYTAARTRRST